MRLMLIALFALAACGAARATPLTAADKAALTKGTNDSCLENQVKDAANKAMTVGQLQTYCDCYAKAFADIMSVEDLDKNKDGLTAEVSKKANEFSQKCAATTLKK
ncbi:MAG TPA: hypothetical protein VJS63_03645 [Bradyrhizobium sp.]|nr:hypothetical protein [Bradyrhizobium sp.]